MAKEAEDKLGMELTSKQKPYEELGIDPIHLSSDKLKTLRDLQVRNVLLGQTDLHKVLHAIDHEKPFAVMSGIKPSGAYHLGSLLTVREIITFQQLGGIVYFCIADMESYLDTRLSLEKAKELAIDNLADVLTLGLNPKQAIIYRQSEMHQVQHYGLKYSQFVTYNTLKSIYGVKSKIAYYNAALIQVADILLPQIVQGPLPTIVPVGLDQSNHARLTRDIVRKAHPTFELPSFLFHQMIRGLDGTAKMSKSNSQSFFHLNQEDRIIKRVINQAFTGGKETAAEQKKLGANPEKCRIFNLFKFGFELDTNSLLEREMKCRSGELLCGPCKGDLRESVLTFRRDHLERKKTFIELSTEIINSGGEIQDF